MAKRLNTQTKDGTSNKYLCPKCKQKYLVKDGKTAGGKQRWACVHKEDGTNAYCYKTTDPTSPMRDQGGRTVVADANPQFRRPLSGVKKFIITCAQNATPLHTGFWNSLMAYCNDTGAELVVIPIRYRNPTSRWTQSQENAEYWEVPAGLLYNQRKKLCDNLLLMADIKTRPTAEQPLSGFEGFSHGMSAIVGHPKLQLRSIPTPQAKLPKIITTTGCCTVSNYTDSKAGKKGEFHHTLGACVVEIRGNKFHMRQANACRDGSFIDGHREYLPDGTARNAPPALGLVMGDTHARFADPAVMEATFGQGGIVDWLNPAALVWHDLLDGYAINPHHRDDPFIALAKHKSGYNDIRAEVEFTIDFLRRYTGDNTSYVVASNHDDFLNRWMRTSDWRRDPVNAQFYLDTARLMAEGTTMTKHGTETPDPFAHWVEQLKGDSDITCLAMDESLMIGDIECGYHGHRGPNGARGSVKNLSRLGVRMMTGHGHALAIEEGHYRVGTSTYLKQEYTEGPSNWMNTHGVVYANSKRTLLNIIDGEYRM